MNDSFSLDLISKFDQNNVSRRAQQIVGSRRDRMPTRAQSYMRNARRNQNILQDIQEQMPQQYSGVNQTFIERRILDPNNSMYMELEPRSKEQKKWQTQYTTKIGRNLNMKRPIPLEIQPREYQQFVQQFLSQRDGTSQMQMQRQFMINVKQKISDEAVTQQMRSIEKQIFYYPSDELINLLGQKFKQILFKTIVMRFQDLLKFKKRSSKKVDDQITYIMTYVWGWGPYFLDLQKLQAFAQKKFATKTGDGTNKIFKLPFYDLQINVQKQQVTMMYKGVVVSPMEFQARVLRTMAVQKIKSKIVNLIYQFKKHTQALLRNQLKR